MKDINRYQVHKDVEIRGAIKKMDAGGIGLIVVIDDNGFVVGIVTDGDFRRSILENVQLDRPIHLVTNKNYVYIEGNYTQAEVRKLFNDVKIRHIPVLKNGKLCDIIVKDGLSLSKEVHRKINIPTVIMAGGVGTRLDPFTRILPKPLIPMGDKPIIEIIMDEFAQFGVNDFYISINYKGRMIRAFFDDHPSTYKINYIEENKQLGTIGALKLLHKILKKPFFVSNCDIIIKDDYSTIYDFHKKGKYDLTLVASMQHHTIPYGVCEIENGGELKNITEKPEYDFLANTGMYILNPEMLNYIPKDTLFHITDLISELKKNNLKIGVYPVSGNSWIDVGQWTEYKNAIDKLNVHEIY